MQISEQVAILVEECSLHGFYLKEMVSNVSSS